MECPQCSFDYDPCGGSCKGCPSEHKSHTTFPCNACCRKVTIHDQYGRSGVRGGRYVPRFDFCPNCGVNLKPEKKAAEWVKWPSIHDSRWACSGCSHQMGAANAGQLPEECPGCGATMVVSDHDPEPPEEPICPICKMSNCGYDGHYKPPEEPISPEDLARNETHAEAEFLDGHECEYFEHKGQRICKYCGEPEKEVE